MPSGQTPVVDDDEAVDHEWFSAAEALTLHEAGEMDMLTPTVSMLQRLALFGSTSAAVGAAAGARPDSGVDEVIRIRRGVSGPGRIAYPADPDYVEASAEVETGVIRWPASGR